MREPTPEAAEQSSPEPIREPSPAHHLQVRTPSPEPAPVLTPSPRPDVERTPSPAKYRSPTPEPEPKTEYYEPEPYEAEPEPYEAEPEPHEPEPESYEPETESYEPEFHSKDEGELDDGEEGYDEEEREDEEGYEDEEEDDYDEEVARVTSLPSTTSKTPGISGLPLEALKKAEPGLGENKDFRQKLKKADNTAIDTKAAFPQKRTTPEQVRWQLFPCSHNICTHTIIYHKYVFKPTYFLLKLSLSLFCLPFPLPFYLLVQVDFRNLLKRTSGPEKKDFKSGSGAQLDFRSQLKPKVS